MNDTAATSGMRASESGVWGGAPSGERASESGVLGGAPSGERASESGVWGGAPSGERARRIDWIVTTAAEPWQTRTGLTAQPLTAMPDVMIDLTRERQSIEGFGASFNELGWVALQDLDESQRDEIMREIFAPGQGANLALCRMPIGANDFSRDWYSYDETDGDFALEDFSIGNDHETLIPFIRAAQRHQPDLRLWASPWSPPTWMKRNRHYAGARPVPGFQDVENGLRDDQVGVEGTDMFIVEDPYLAAYAAYFGRFVDAYAKEGIAIGMVMPQNEFNSAQVFPSCTWTPEGLARFLTHLGPEMSRRGVDVFLGTLERADDRLAASVLNDPDAGALISGAGVQWAGKGATPYLHRDFPALTLYQTEQECGDGRNDWRFCRYAWTLMKRFFDDGVSAYMYWNMALHRGGISRWGWAQNSLVVVDPDAGTFEYTHEYHLLKHVSHFVMAGATVIDALSHTGYENLLAFKNPDGSIVVVLHNDSGEEQTPLILVDGLAIAPALPPDSFSTLVLAPAGL